MIGLPPSLDRVIGLSGGALDVLMPMHLWADPEGRVVQAGPTLTKMARRGDLPRGLAHIEADTGSPARATWAVTLLIAGITALGSVSVAWSFSAFTVLVYYGITNAAALRLGPADRFAPRAASWLGLGGCALVAVFVEPRIAAIGVVILCAALAQRALLRRRS